MQTYPVKRGHAKKTDLKQIMEESFGSVDESDDWLTASFGAFKTIKAKYDGLTKLDVDTNQDRNVDMETGQKTIKAWNEFLETATGYTSKQRGKKMQEAAKKAK